MILNLEVTGEQAEDLGAGCRKSFDSIGGTIGRLPDNDWVFPDPYVSGRHALIRYLSGKFFIEDTSTNGVFINSPDNRLPRDGAHQLRSGDTIYIDAYKIKVFIEQPSAKDRQNEDPFELLRARAKDERANLTVAMSPPVAADDRTAAMVKIRDEPAVEWVGIEMDEVDGPQAHAQARRAAKASQQSARATAVAPAAKSNAAEAVDGDLINALIAAAGIRGVTPTPELAQTLGSVLRVAVAGLMDALRGREQIKDDMGVRGTTFQAQDNNPLKFSANVDDAFHNLLVKQNAAYLSPPEAVEDALRDVREHQTAIIAAMRLTFESMLAQFDPDRMQEDFDRQLKKGSILGVPAKLRYWDLYREQYGELAKAGDASFRTLFADEFARAYEEQMDAAARNRQK